MLATYILALVLVLTLSLVYLYFWIKSDLENKRGYTIYNRDGKKVSNFGDWLDEEGDSKRGE